MVRENEEWIRRIYLRYKRTDIREDYKGENRGTGSNMGSNFKFQVSVNVDWHGVYTDKKGV